MRILDLALNAIVILTATIFLAYIGFTYFDFGLFTTLPESVSGFFLRNGVLRWVALGVLVAALISKVPLGRAIRRREAGRRM